MSIQYQDALAKGKVDGAHPGGFHLTKKLLRELKITKETKILDAGCGTGQTSLYLAKTYGCTIVSVDKHPGMVRNFRNRLKGTTWPIETIQADIEQLPFSDESFDLILAESVIAFTQIEKSLSELKRVLKPKGTLFCNEMTKEDHLKSYEAAEIMDFYDLQQMFTKQDWLHCLDQTGFKNISVLKNNSLLDELLLHANEETLLDSMEEVGYSEQVEEVLEKQSILLMKYAEKIGHIVVKGTKA